MTGFVNLDPSRTALLVVDVQNDFCHPEGAFARKRGISLEHVEQALRSLSSFIDKCRQLHLPVIFVKTTHSPWTDSDSWLRRVEGKAGEMSICPPNAWGSEFYKVDPKAMDCIVTKHRYSAFVGTDLDLVLRSKQIQNVLVTGVVTNVCVETTARDAFTRDYNVILVEDCCGAYEPAEHEASLNNIRKYFGKVAGSRELIEGFETPEKARLT